MKKLIEKEKNLRKNVQKMEKLSFVLKSISKNCNLFILTRWKAFSKLEVISKKTSKVALSPRCVYSVNKKRFNKLTTFSRHIFLKLIRSGKISGMQKSSW